MIVVVRLLVIHVKRTVRFGSEEWFSLIEIMVVVAIVAILAAIATLHIYNICVKDIVLLFNPK